MEDDQRPTIDLATTALPRMVTEMCIGSVLRCWEDRQDFRIRWIFHLTRYPTPQLDPYWKNNIDVACKMAEQMEEFVLLAPRENVCYGQAVRNVLEWVRNDTLWIEDDKYFDVPFRVAELRKRPEDGVVFNYAGPRMRGQPLYYTTGPIFWKQAAIERVRKGFPTDTIHQSERSLIRHFDKQFNVGVLENRYWIDKGMTPLENVGIWPPLRVHKNYVDPETKQPVRLS
jgi:hypothetical protein